MLRLTSIVLGAPRLTLFVLYVCTHAFDVYKTSFAPLVLWVFAPYVSLAYLLGRNLQAADPASVNEIGVWSLVLVGIALDVGLTLYYRWRWRRQNREDDAVDLDLDADPPLTRRQRHYEEIIRRRREETPELWPNVPRTVVSYNLENPDGPPPDQPPPSRPAA